ncbi:ABC transporter substrate-binding protein [Marinivivus vitaminiproducens]|uniref:ABC transporter substrate-binding protein n=1 Tax=Marinivivus vitaminiproducens TaxID=3035935 RepID=UPI0027A9C646|nr:ABC transporter substrate-binding protein [Geminicoccaceae bacterium SCSIO 64248]
MSFNRRSLLSAGMALAGVALAHISSSSRAQSAIDLSDVTLRVGDQTGATRAKFEAAGLLDDVPYTIDWSVHAAAVNLHEALKAGAIDIGSAADSPTVSAIAGASRIKAVAGWSNGGKGRFILVPQDSPIGSLEDLAGRTLSPTTRGSVAHYLVVGALKKAGLTTDEVTLAFLSPVDATAALSAGSIDAWGTWGVYAARAIGQGARILLSGEGINSGLLVLSATDDALTDPGKTAAIADFADRLDRAYAWSSQDKNAWVDFYATFSKQDEKLVDVLYEDERAYARVPVDDAFVSELQRTYDTWVEAEVLPDRGLDLGAYVYRDLATSRGEHE